MRPRMSARWTCGKCGTTLRFDPVRRAVLAIGLVTLVALFFLLVERVPYPLLLTSYVVLMALLGLVDGVVAAEDRDKPSNQGPLG